MKENTVMEFHPAANIFPMMTEEELESLSQDIDARGLEVPIQLMDGMVLDGRNRWLACRMIGKTPKTVQVNPADPIAYVLSINLMRRHLDDGQQAMVGGRAKELYERQAKERMSKGGGDKKSGAANWPHPIEDQGRSRDKAGEAVGVSGKQIDRAVKVLTHGSKELIAACDRGEVAVSAAAKLAVLPKSQQNEVISQAKQDGKDVGKAVSQAAKNAVPKTDAEWSESEIERKDQALQGLAVVANKRADQVLIRWAIENGCFMPIDRGTQWGNPFVVDDDGDRDTVCESYEVYFDLKPSLQAKLETLRGKVLGCWCYPERCHGNHLAELTNE